MGGFVKVSGLNSVKEPVQEAFNAKPKPTFQVGKAMSRTIIVALTLILVTSIVMGQATAVTVQKPSVPEFTVKYGDNSYDIPPTYGTDQYTGKTIVTNDGEHIDNRTLVFTIKNQPFTPFTDPSSNKTVDLLYDIRYKGSFGQDWTRIFGGEVTLYAGTEYPYAKTGYPVQDYGSEYTTITYTLPWNVPSEGKLDFQVKAFAGYTKFYGDSHIIIAFGSYTFYGEESEWSDTQTLTLGDPQTPTPAPTAPPTLMPTVTPTLSPAATQSPTANPVQPNGGIEGNFAVSWEQGALIVCVAVIAALIIALALSRRRKA
jgi:hypothetical protein